MRMLFSFVCVSVLWFTVADLSAQNPHFGLFTLNPLKLNPAVAGMSEGNQRVSLHQRSQWGAAGTPFRTFALASDMKVLKRRLPKNNLGLGLHFESDRAGEVPLRSSALLIDLAYQLRSSSKSFIGFGLEVGYRSMNLDLTSGTWANQFNGLTFDPSLPSGETVEPQPVNQFILGAGLHATIQEGGHRGYLSPDKNYINAGLSFRQFSQPDASFYPLDNSRSFTQVTLHADGNLFVNTGDVSARPSLLFQMQGPHRLLMIGGSARYLLNPQSRYTGLIRAYAVSLGLHYRWGDAIVPSATAEVGAWTVMVGYHINTSRITETIGGRGGFEVGIRLTNPNPLGGRLLK